MAMTDATVVTAEPTLKTKLGPVKFLGGTVTMVMGSADGDINQATITLDIGGRHVTEKSDGNGPIDASLRAIDKIVDHGGTLTELRIKSVGPGTSAPGRVGVDMKTQHGSFAQDNTNTNTVRAAIEAYIGAINKIRLNGG